MRVKFLLAVFLVLGLVGNVWAQGSGERPDRPNKPTKGGFIPGPKPLEPQCTADAAEKGLRMCYDWDQTQRDDMHACPESFAIAGGGNGNNHFYCVYTGPYTGSYVAGNERQQFESMVCKTNYFATGLREDKYKLRCATTGAKVTKAAPQNLGDMTLCPGTVAGKQLAVVIGWNTLKGQAICAITDPAPALTKKK